MTYTRSDPSNPSFRFPQIFTVELWGFLLILCAICGPDRVCTVKGRLTWMGQQYAFIFYVHQWGNWPPSPRHPKACCLSPVCPSLQPATPPQDHNLWVLHAIGLKLTDFVLVNPHPKPARWGPPFNGVWFCPTSSREFLFATAASGLLGIVKNPKIWLFDMLSVFCWFEPLVFFRGTNFYFYATLLPPTMRGSQKLQTVVTTECQSNKNAIPSSCIGGLFPSPGSLAEYSSSKGSQRHLNHYDSPPSNTGCARGARLQPEPSRLCLPVPEVRVNTGYNKLELKYQTKIDWASWESVENNGRITWAHRPSSGLERCWNIFNANSYGSSTSKNGISLISFCK